MKDELTFGSKLDVFGLNLRQQMIGFSSRDIMVEGASTYLCCAEENVE